MLELRKIILGTAQLGLHYGINNLDGSLIPSFSDKFEILTLAYDSGINYLDTAENYGDAHEFIGLFHHQNPSKIFKVFSKFTSEKLYKNNLRDSVVKDLKDLNVNELEGYMFHSYIEYIKYPKLMNELLSLRKAGLIKKIGISIYSIEKFKDLLNDENINFIQLPFNLLDNSIEKIDLIHYAKMNGKEIQVRSIFLQGLFFMNRDSLPQKLKPLEKYLKQIDAIKEKTKLSMEEFALGYIKNNEDIDFILIGVDTIDQLKRNILNRKLAKLNLTLIQAFQEIDKIKVKEIELLNPNNW